MKLEEALRRAFSLGQVFMDQVTSDSYKRRMEASETQASFMMLQLDAAALFTEKREPLTKTLWLNIYCHDECIAHHSRDSAIEGRGGDVIRKDWLATVPVMYTAGDGL